MKKNMVFGIAMTILLGVMLYFLLPVLSLQFYMLPIIGIVFVLTLFLGTFEIENTALENTRLNGYQKCLLGICSLLTLYVLVGFIGSSAFFTWETKQAQLALVDIVEFDSTVPNVDMAHLIILDEQDALRASEKLITETNPTLGSLFQIGEGTLSVVQDKPYWIFPMEYRSFFKWVSQRGNIPGYIKVSATDFNDSEFVNVTYAISPTGYLSQDLKRTVYTRYSGYGLRDYSFEVDDDGKPYWVVTAYKKSTWMSTEVVEGVIIVDPVNGEMVFYNVGDQPEWVDRVYDVSMFDKQLSWYGKYINGWWNPSDEGKLKDTEGKGYVFKDGNIYFYTGLTSYGKDSATTGFVIYNPRTGEAEYNRLSGSIEQKAIGLMEELVQNAGYTASYPYLININGEATYFSTLKGNSGNVVGYAFASVRNYKAVAWGKTLREAQTEYNRSLLRESGSNALAGQSVSLEVAEGSVSRVGVLSEGYYVVKFVGNSQLYVVNSEQFPYVALTVQGDVVTIGYLETESSEKIDAISFSNKSIQ